MGFGNVMDVRGRVLLKNRGLLNFDQSGLYLYGRFFGFGGGGGYKCTGCSFGLISHMTSHCIYGQCGGD